MFTYNRRIPWSWLPAIIDFDMFDNSKLFVINLKIYHSQKHMLWGKYWLWQIASAVDLSHEFPWLNYDPLTQIVGKLHLKQNHDSRNWHNNLIELSLGVSKITEQMIPPEVMPLSILSSTSCQHVEVETKWPPFRWRYFQMHFLKKTSQIWLTFHWRLFLVVKLTMIQHWFWPGTNQATRHYLTEWCLVYRRNMCQWVNSTWDCNWQCHMTYLKTLNL